MDENTKRIILNFMNSNTILSLSTSISDSPYICNLFYVCDDDLNIYFLSSNKTRHAQELKDNPKVAVSIYDPKSAPGKSVIGLQAVGKVSEAKGMELVKMFASYLKLFPATKIDINMLKQVSFDSRLFKFKPDIIYFMDKSHFEKRQEVVL